MPKYYEAISRSEDNSFKEWALSEEGSYKRMRKMAMGALTSKAYINPNVVEVGFIMWTDKNGPLVAICRKGSIEDYREYWEEFV